MISRILLEFKEQIPAQVNDLVLLSVFSWLLLAHSADQLKCSATPIELLLELMTDTANSS